MISAEPVNPGRMDRRLTLIKPVSARNSIGESVDTWVRVRTVWAQWLPKSSREFISAQARNAETAGVLRIRWQQDLEATWRVSMGDDTYRLDGDPIELGRREYLDVPVVALNQSPGTSLLTYVDVALEALAAMSAAVVRLISTNGATSATATAQAATVRDHAASAETFGSASLTAAHARTHAISVPLASTAAAGVTRRAVSVPEISSVGDTIVDSDGNQIIAHEYS